MLSISFILKFPSALQSLHFILDCFLYTVKHQTLFKQLVPNFNELSKHKKYEVLVMGIKSDNPEYYHTNTRISYAVQNFLFKTKLFTE